MSGHLGHSRRRRAGGLRRLSQVLALMMVPVVLVGMPNVAQAAESSVVYGNAASTSFTTNTGLADLNVSCEVVGYYVVSGDNPPTVHGDLACSTSWAVSSALVGFTLDGGGCDFSWPAEQVDGEGKLGFVMAAGPEYSQPSCMVTELCWTVAAEGHSTPWKTYNYSGCELFPLGAPPMGETPPGECAYAQNVRAFEQLHEIAERGNSWPAHWGDYRFRAMRDAVLQDTSDWHVYVVHRPMAAGSGSGATSQLLLGGQAFVKSKQEVAGNIYGGGALLSAQESLQDSSGNPQQNTWAVGFGMYRRASTGQGSTNSTQAAGKTPQDVSWGLLGVSDPNRCSFYWGTKIASTPNDTFDEPLSGINLDPPLTEPPLTDPPEPVNEDAGCDGFSISDPATWGGQAFCMMVKVLIWIYEQAKKIVGAIRGLVDAIGTLLQDLLVPSPDSWGLDSLQTQWDNRGPGVVVSEIADGFGGVSDGYQSGGGCGSLADFSNDDISANVTCTQVRDSGGMAALYSLVQAGLIALTCWGIWHIVVGSIKADA